MYLLCHLRQRERKMTHRQMRQLPIKCESVQTQAVAEDGPIDWTMKFNGNDAQKKKGECCSAMKEVVGLS